MTNHITQEHVFSLAKKLGMVPIVPPSGKTSNWVTDLCNAAIQHYIDHQPKPAPGELPPLPESVGYAFYISNSDSPSMEAHIYRDDLVKDGEKLHTADQLQAYGDARAEQMKERVVKACESESLQAATSWKLYANPHDLG